MKSLDKKKPNSNSSGLINNQPTNTGLKPKKLDWEKKLINSGKHLADILEQYNGNRQCKLCGAEPEKQSEWVIFLVKKLLTQQRTELLEEILNLECLKEEDWGQITEFGEARLLELYNSIIRKIKEEIKKL